MFLLSSLALVLRVMFRQCVQNTSDVCESDSEGAGGDLCGLVQGHQTPAGSPSLAAPP